MADIKQAAKWMEEGKKVTRPGLQKGYFSSDIFIQWEDGSERDMLQTEDLLADDWEIALKEQP